MSFLGNLFSQKQVIRRQVQTPHVESHIPMSLNVFADKQIERIYIDIGGSSLKVMCVEFLGSSRSILWIEEIQLGPMDGLYSGSPVPDVYKVLPEALSKIKDKIYNHKNVFVSLPTEGVFFKTIEVINIANKDMLIKSEMKKQIPIPFEDLLFSSNLIEKKERQEKYLCVAMQKEYLGKFDNIFKEFKIDAYFELESFSLARLMQRSGKMELMVDIGSEYTKCVFVKDGDVFSVKKIELGSKNINSEMKNKLEIDLEAAEEFKTRFAEMEKNKLDTAGAIKDFILEFSIKISKDISSCVLEFEREFPVHVDTIYVCGGGSEVLNLKENIEHSFQSEINLKHLNFQKLCEDNANLLHEKNTFRFAQCMGLLMMHV
jgi:Tfp pilus assembly PilM family ATPase